MQFLGQHVSEMPKSEMPKAVSEMRRTEKGAFGENRLLRLAYP